jgi:hypothetical protein
MMVEFLISGGVYHKLYYPLDKPCMERMLIDLFEESRFVGIPAYALVQN